MTRGWERQETRARMTAAISAILLERRELVRRKDAEKEKGRGETQAAPAEQKSNPLWEAEPSVQTWMGVQWGRGEGEGGALTVEGFRGAGNAGRMEDGGGACEEAQVGKGGGGGGRGGGG